MNPIARILISKIAFLYLCTVVLAASLYADCSKENYFGKADYESLMQLVAQISPDAHRELIACESRSGCQCIRKAVDTDTKVIPIDEGNYIIIIEPEFLGIIDEPSARDYLKTLFDSYADPVSRQNSNLRALKEGKVKQVLEIVQSIDPAAYHAITKKDPTGKEHITIDPAISAIAGLAPSTKDGLPSIYVDKDLFFTFPRNEQRFILAHELGHYKMGHFKEAFKLKSAPPDRILLSNAHNRNREHEADRIAILDFGINLDDAISFVKSRITATKEQELKKWGYIKGLKLTHPFWEERLKHLEGLRRELEIKKAPILPVDYDALSQKYFKALKKMGLTK